MTAFLGVPILFVKGFLGFLSFLNTYLKECYWKDRDVASFSLLEQTLVVAGSLDVGLSSSRTNQVFVRAPVGASFPYYTPLSKIS